MKDTGLGKIGFIIVLFLLVIIPSVIGIGLILVKNKVSPDKYTYMVETEAIYSDSANEVKYI